MGKGARPVYVADIPSRQGGRHYHTILLRESYREGGKVRNRTIANLTGCKPAEIEAIRYALAHKNELEAIALAVGQQAAGCVRLEEGQSVGALWCAYDVARQVGIERALGSERQGRLALWQVLARLIGQGSRLAAVRLAQTHCACDVLGIDQGFCEDDLYDNLGWLEEHQEEIEQALFSARRRGAPRLFLYDVTSSYLEGTRNELGDWGYNRDKKKGKQQIVIGLLCDEEGEPVSVEVFRGNTQDLKTFGSQVKKVAERFGCERVTLVGDRGMIKSAQVNDLQRAGFHFITAITKAQIRVLLNEGVLQMELFDDNVCEVDCGTVRYIVRRNPRRAEDLRDLRERRQASVAELAANQTRYLAEHPRARVETARNKVREKIQRLDVDAWLGVEAQGRRLELRVDEAAREHLASLDGCYVLQSDVPAEAANVATLHDRYKDLTLVEQAFRTCKTAHLEVRPVYVRTEEHTRGHVLVVMLAYLIVRRLHRAWASMDLTVEEGLRQLATLSTMKVRGPGQCATAYQIPRPRETSRQLLELANVRLPEALPCRGTRVVTRTRLPKRRK